MGHSSVTSSTGSNPPAPLFTAIHTWAGFQHWWPCWPRLTPTEEFTPSTPSHFTPPPSSLHVHPASPSVAGIKDFYGTCHPFQTLQFGHLSNTLNKGNSDFCLRLPWCPNPTHPPNTLEVLTLQIGLLEIQPFLRGRDNFSVWEYTESKNHRFCV